MSQYAPKSGENRHKTAAIMWVFVGAVKARIECYDLVIYHFTAPKKIIKTFKTP